MEIKIEIPIDLLVEANIRIGQHINIQNHPKICQYLIGKLTEISVTKLEGWGTVPEKDSTIEKASFTIRAEEPTGYAIDLHKYIHEPALVISKNGADLMKIYLDGKVEGSIGDGYEVSNHLPTTFQPLK